MESQSEETQKLIAVAALQGILQVNTLATAQKIASLALSQIKTTKTTTTTTTMKRKLVLDDDDDEAEEEAGGSQPQHPRIDGVTYEQNQWHFCERNGLNIYTGEPKEVLAISSDEDDEEEEEEAIVLSSDDDDE